MPRNAHKHNLNLDFCIVKQTLSKLKFMISNSFVITSLNNIVHYGLLCVFERVYILLSTFYEYTIMDHVYYLVSKRMDDSSLENWQYLIIVQKNFA